MVWGRQKSLLMQVHYNRSMNSAIRSFFLSILLVPLAVCSGHTAHEANAQSYLPEHDASESRTFIVWISLDGLRWDYLDKAETPTLDRLVREGAFTRALAPAFPTLTFPTHVSLVTGVPVSEHGIAANGYYDRRLSRVMRYPPDASLVESEPIWITAERQGVRSAVFDWPVSHRQQGEVTASYFGTGYDPRLPDEARLLQVIDAWENDSHEQPLQLLMGYAVATDSPGHRYGPDAPEMVAVIESADTLAGWFLQTVMDVAADKLGDDDELYFVITTDHGMSTVHSAVHPRILLGLEDRREIEVITSGNIGNVYLDNIESAAERQALTESILSKAGAHHFAQAYLREDVPERLGYAHPNTVGDVVVIIDRGYTFSSRPDELVVDVSTIGGPLGMHGYDVETNPDMYGLTVFWRFPEPLGGIDLGRVDYRSIHPTISELLGIEPAPNAMGVPLRLDSYRQQAVTAP